jgi:hypothetical protein
MLTMAHETLGGLPPGVGHNSRGSDIRRTAEELLKDAEQKREIAFNTGTAAGAKRAEYLRKWTDAQKFPPVVQTLNAAALAPDVTGDEFKKLYVLSRIGGGKAEGIELDNESLAVLMHTDPRSWQKTKANLRAKEWLDEKPTHRSGKQWVNAYSLKNPLASLIAADTPDTENDFRDGQTNHPKNGQGWSDEPSQNGFRDGQKVPFGVVEPTALPGDPGNNHSNGKSPSKGKASKGTFLRKDMTLPPEWLEHARSVGLSDTETTEEFRKFHRWYTSANREVRQKRQRDWMEKWVEWLERYLNKRDSGHSTGSSYGPNGQYIGKTL